MRVKKQKREREGARKWKCVRLWHLWISGGLSEVPTAEGRRLSPLLFVGNKEGKKRKRGLEAAKKGLCVNCSVLSSIAGVAYNSEHQGLRFSPSNQQEAISPRRPQANEKQKAEDNPIKNIVAILQQGHIISDQSRTTK